MSILKSGNTLGPFRLERALGSGAFKTVYPATNLEPGKNPYPERVALCVPHAQDEEAHRLLRHEFRIIGSLNHPSIVRVYGIEEENDCLFMVMELAEGEALNAMLRNRTVPLTLEEATKLVSQVGKALDHAHDCLAFHRDIKPANIVLCRDGSVKLLDFGIARLLTHSRYSGSWGGTIDYMAPEQFQGSVGLTADIWSLGVTFFELITRKLPFTADHEGAVMKQILYDEPDLGILETLGYDPRLVGVFRKVLSKDPEKRYRRAGEFVADLESVLRRAAIVNEFEGQIEALLRAHFPLVFIQSYEEERVLASLEQVRQIMALNRPTELFIWSETRGLRDQAGRLLLPDSPGDPVPSLEYIAKSQTNGIYVFLDIHRHFAPVTTRLIRDAIWTVKRCQKSLIFVSPVLSIPDELMADTTLIFHDYPYLDQLRRLVSTLAAEQPAEQPLDTSLPDTLSRSLLGLTLVEAERVLRRSVLRQGGLTKDCVPEILAEKEQIIRKSGILEFYPRTGGFADVGGLDLLKEWFRKRRQAFTGEGQRYGLPAPRGVVLTGVPGCGKSLSAKALAGEWGAPLVRLDMGRVYSSLLGETEANLRKALHTAEAVSPCILWIDELEKAFGGRGQSRDSGVSQRVFGVFLNWLEERVTPVFVVATANDIGSLPAEFTRKGRFDDIFFVDLPTERERQAILEVHLSRRNRFPEAFDLKHLAQVSVGFSGAELEETVISALYRAFDEGERELRTEDIAAACQQTVPLSKSRANDLVRLRLWARNNFRMAQG